MKESRTKRDPAGAPGLREAIASEIARSGPIPFSRYMELCLYAPDLGYYSRENEKFGKAGDFYTSSDFYAVFGRLLARQFDEMWRALGSPEKLHVIELGPGRGLFARDALSWSEKKFPDFFHALHYFLVERSPSLHRRLGVRLADFIASHKASLHAGLPNEIGEAACIIYANEFFDALPVEVVTHQGQLFIATEVSADSGRSEGNDSSNLHFVERFLPASPAVLRYQEDYGVHPQQGERMEAALEAVGWMQKLSHLIERGFLVVIDYGYLRAEQLTGRNRGTVAAYRKHRMTSPYQAPGDQDITAHVNFSALQLAGEAAGLNALGLRTQSQFLLGIGKGNDFADVFEEAKLPQEWTKKALQLKHLITPEGMGESFRVLLMAKGVDREAGIRLRGLSFAR